MASIKGLRKRIDDMPEPYRSRAMENYRDAIDDLTNWPQHCKRIVDDLEAAVEAHEFDVACWQLEYTD